MIFYIRIPTEGRVSNVVLSKITYRFDPRTMTFES